MQTSRATIAIFLSLFSIVVGLAALPLLTPRLVLAASTRLQGSVPPGRAYLPLIVGQHYTAATTATPSPTVTPTPAPRPTVIPPADWLARVNYYRATAGLPPVWENSTWNEGDWLHARYCVKTDTIMHGEDSTSPWYTPAGAEAARFSLVAVTTATDTTDAELIDAWMQAPFHAVSILDPELQAVGFGSYREGDGGMQMAAALDVIRGLQGPPPTGIYPVMWPGPGATVLIRQLVVGSPSPLTSCPGYAAPTGPPIILQIGPGDLTPRVTGHEFLRGNVPLEHCVFDETSYINPDATSQDLGRRILDARDAIVLIPRQPLQPGAVYTVSVTVAGKTYRWSFGISERTSLPGS